MKKLVILLSLGAFLIVSCEMKETGPQVLDEQETQISDMSFTPCQQTKAAQQNELSDRVDVMFTHEGVQITHYNFEVTCDFTTVRVTHTFVNGVLNITQQGFPNQAKCICYTDVSYTINGMSPERVNVIFINGVQIYCYNDKDEDNTTAFCFYLNLENIDKTIPVINDYLESLESHLNDEQKLQALVTWLKSSPCVIDANILCISCIYTLPAISEISFSFQEEGATIEAVLDIVMTDPLNARICSIKEISQGGGCDTEVTISVSEYETAPEDYFVIEEMKIEGNCLKIKFSASGCDGSTWVVKLIDSGTVYESTAAVYPPPPAQRRLRLSLDNKEDCRAIITKEMSFNIEDLQIQRANRVFLHISGNQILYEY